MDREGGASGGGRRPSPFAPVHTWLVSRIPRDTAAAQINGERRLNCTLFLAPRRASTTSRRLGKLPPPPPLLFPLRFPLPQRKRLPRFSDGNKSDRQTHRSCKIPPTQFPSTIRRTILQDPGLRGKAFPSAASQQEACITLRQLLDFLPITHHFAAPLNFHSRRSLHISRGGGIRIRNRYLLERELTDEHV